MSTVRPHVAPDASTTRPSRTHATGTRPTAVDAAVTLAGRMWALVAPRSAYQRSLYVAGALLVVGGLVHFAALAADDFAWSGPVSSRKPALFGVSLGLSAWSLGWVLGVLPHRRMVGWFVATTVGAFSIVEWALITLQRWRGVPSHFNASTPFDAAVFSAMGGAIGLVTIGVVVTFAWSVRELRVGGDVRWAALAGLGLLLVASGLGGDLIARGTEMTEATGVVPDAVRVGAAGSGRLAHAVGIHALQVLPGLAVLLQLGGVATPRRARLIRRASLAYALGFAAVVAQVYAGRALTDLTWATVVAPTAGAVVAWTAVVALRQLAAVSRPRDHLAA